MAGRGLAVHSLPLKAQGSCPGEELGRNCPEILPVPIMNGLTAPLRTFHRPPQDGYIFTHC